MQGHKQEAPAAADMRLNFTKKRKEMCEANVSERKDRYKKRKSVRNSLTTWRDSTTSVRLSISDFTLRSDIWVPETSTCPWGASPFAEFNFTYEGRHCGLHLIPLTANCYIMFFNSFRHFTGLGLLYKYIYILISICWTWDVKSKSPTMHMHADKTTNEEDPRMDTVILPFM